MKLFRTKLVIALIVLICGVSLMGLVYIVFNKPDKIINPGVVVSSSSPVATPVQPISPRMSIYSSAPMHHSSYALHTSHSAQPPQAAMQPARGLYTTSSAQPHSVGGGNGINAVYSSSHGSSARGINYGSATTMPMGSFVAMASNRQVAEPGANDAPMMASIAPRHAPGPPQPPGPLDPEHQLVEQPVGDALWTMILLITVYSAVCVYRRRRSA